MLKAPEAARGLRNHNPGNLRRTRDKWQGLAKVQSDAEFFQFVAPQWGIRALAKVLLSYERKGLNTVEEIVSRFAPSSENKTDAYILHVAAKLDVQPNDYIDVDDLAVMRPLVEAIILHENGRQPYSAGVILEGLRLAGVSNAEKVGLRGAKGLATQAVASASSLLAAGSLAAPEIKRFADGLEPFAASPLIVNISVALVTVAGLLSLGGAVAGWLRQRKGL